MFRYIVFSVLMTDLILNADGCSSIASFVDFVSDQITTEKQVGGNAYEILKPNHRSKVNLDFKIFLKYDYSWCLPEF